MRYLCHTLAHSITYKQLGVFFLLAALCIQSFNRVLIISDYYLDTASYAAQCENKANVTMHCNGKCQMAKKLKKEDDKDKKNPERKIQNQNDFYLSGPQLFVIPTLTSYSNGEQFPILPNPKTMDRPHSVFKPPTV